MKYSFTTIYKNGLYAETIEFSVNTLGGLLWALKSIGLNNVVMIYDSYSGEIYFDTTEN